jgi:hypothetical protein
LARKLLRIGSLGLAAGAAFGVLFGGFHIVKAFEVSGYPFSSGLLVGWGIVVWGISAIVAVVAVWTWRARFKPAAIALTIAGLISGDWARLYLGSGQPLVGVPLTLVTAAILPPTAAAIALKWWLGAHHPESADPN